MSDDGIRCLSGRGGVVAMVVGLVAVACGGEPDVAGRGDAPESPVVGVEWLVVETSVGASTSAAPAELDVVVRFDGEGGWSADGCNSLGGGVEVDGLHLSFDPETVSTAVGCSEPEGVVDDAVAAVLQGEVDAVVQDDELTLTGSGSERMRLEVRDGIYPSPTMTSLDEGTRGEGDYRFGFEAGDGGGGGPYASWEFRSAPGRPWSFAGAGPIDPHRPDPLPGDAGEPAKFVLGVIGADVTRVAYEPPSGGATELELHPLGPDFANWQAYGGFVDHPVAGSHVVAYDATGTELGRSSDLRWC